LHLAEIALATGGYDQAEALLRESLAEIGSFPPLRYEVLSALACNALQRGQGEQAKGYAVEALRIASDPDHSTIRPPLLPVTTAARLLRDGGHSERAVELYALASSHAFVANSHWFHEIAGRHIAAAAESLPLEVVAAAQERGRARDLWETAKELLEELTELKP